MRYDFKLRDEVWVANAKAHRKRITCPDCFGTGQFDVIMKDGTAHSIECATCTLSYYGPQGTIETWEYEPSVELVTITKIEQNIDSPTEYLAGNFIYSHDKIFSNQEDAAKYAKTLVEQQSKEEIDRLSRKENPNKSWAWNVSYHRKAIRSAQKNLEYHTAKLNVAKLKAKSE